MNIRVENPFNVSVVSSDETTIRVAYLSSASNFTCTVSDGTPVSVAVSNDSRYSVIVQNEQAIAVSVAECTCGGSGDDTLVSGVIERDVDGNIDTVTKETGEVITIYRTDGVISSVTKGSTLIEFSRDIDGRISSWSVG